jgi:serine/threonine protein phosphatase PrpC
MDSKTIFATATITNKSENQDSNGELNTDLLTAILVADGLGSYKYAQMSSNSVIGTLLRQLKNIEIVDSLDFDKLFRIAKEELIEVCGKTKTEEDKNNDCLFGTTLIAIAETESKIKIAYTGNGAIWHIRGNFDEFPQVYQFPWNAVNLLNPHSIPEKGMEALYRLISDNNNFDECFPTEIEIEKDSQQGDIFMICSDGIYSEDQRNFGTNSKGIWVKYESTMQQFFKHLKHFFELQEYSNEKLDDALNKYLKEIKSDLDDDATLGVLITGKTIDYQKNKRQLVVNENNTDNQIKE